MAGDAGGPWDVAADLHGDFFVGSGESALVSGYLVPTPGALRLYDAATLKLLRTFDVEASGFNGKFALSPDGATIAALSIFAALSAEQVGWLYNVEDLTSAQTSQITSAAAPYLTQEQLNNFSASALAGLSPAIFSKLTGQQVGELYNVQDLTSAQTS